MYSKHRGGHPFSDMLRRHASEKSGTSKVGMPKGKQPHATPNPGGVGVTVSAARSKPKASAFMDGKDHTVRPGGGSMQHQRGIDNHKRTPANIPQSTRLGNFGEPSGHAEHGTDAPFGGMEREGMPGKTPANMEGKAHRVKKSGKGKKPKWNIGDAHHNHGAPKIGGHPRSIGGMRTRDLASAL